MNVTPASGGRAVHRQSNYSRQAERALSPACSPTGILTRKGMVRFVRTDAPVTCTKCQAPPTA